MVTSCDVLPRDGVPWEPPGGSSPRRGPLPAPGSRTRVPLEFSIERGPPQADLPGRLRRRHSTLHQQERGGALVLIEGRPSGRVAFGPALAIPSRVRSAIRVVRTGQSPQDVEHQLAGGRRGIELFLQGAQRNAALLEGLDDLQQLAERPPQRSRRTTASVSPGTEVIEQTGEPGRLRSCRR